MLGAAEDGGYWLLGLTAPHEAPFQDIAWSTDGVAAATRARLDAAGLRTAALATWYDVDDPPALTRLMRAVQADAAVAPHTHAAMQALGLPERLA